MKFFLKLIITLLIILLLAIAGLYISGNKFLLKGVWATYLHGETSATITDKKYFAQRVVTAEGGQEWPRAAGYNAQPLSDSLQNTLERTNSIAFLVIRQDSILQEHYWGIGSDTSRTNSFSMAKSITTMLAQIAIQKGVFNNWDDPLITYLPNLNGPYRQELRLKHLVSMTAGLQWNEHYTNPFDITARSYYGPDIYKLMIEQVPVVREPGTEYEYQSGATQFLGLALMEATGKPLAQLASEWLWQPLGAQQSATWHLDSEGGRELAFCCFNSNARDFARLGQLLLNQGNWHEQQILDSAFMQEATQPQMVNYYGRSFWLDSDDHLSDIFYARGILGQYIIIIPEKELVIVRLGHQRLPKTHDEHPQDFHAYVGEVLRYFR